MSGSTKRRHDTDSDDALRELMSSILSGRYTEDTYLGDVESVCRSRPEAAPKLLALIDRYKRIGRMSVAQHDKVRDRIQHALTAIQPASRKADEAEIADDYSEESSTRELEAAPRKTPAPVPIQAAARPAIRPAIRPADRPAAVRPAIIVPAANATRLLPVPAAAASRPTAMPAPLESPPVDARLDAAQTRVMPVDSLLTGAAASDARSFSTRVPVAAQIPGESPPDAALAPPAAARTAISAMQPIGIGTVLHDRYELKLMLGRGGIATVFKAVDRYRVNLGLEDCYVAVKVVQPHPSRPGSVAALGREFHNAQLLSHPNVINVYNIDHIGDTSYYTMELLDGERLSQIMKRVGVLPRRHALAIIRDIGAAIAHAHSRGVVHADLKPHNVMITQTGQVRVLDFGSGLIRAREPWISELTPEDNYRQATPAYASCEQLEGWSADPRDDIFALACLSYLLLTGRHPFNMQPSLDARAQRMQPRRPPGMRNERWRALRRGLSWSREQRTMAVEDWIRELGVEGAAESLPVLAMLTSGKPYSAWVHRAAAAAVVVAALGLAAFTVEHQEQLDWHPTVAKAYERLNGAWHDLQSLADSTDSASDAGTVAAVAPAVVPSVPTATATATANAGRKSPSVNSHAVGATTMSRSARTAGADQPQTPTAAGNMEQKVASLATLAPIATAAADDVANVSNAPLLQFSSASYVVPGTEPAARIVIRRNGNTSGDVDFVWWTEEASAKADVDYASLGRRIERIPSGSDKITVYVPIISAPRGRESSQFYVALGEPGSSRNSAPGSRSLVTIDQDHGT